MSGSALPSWSVTVTSWFQNNPQNTLQNKQSHCLGHPVPLSKSTLSTVSWVQIPMLRNIIQGKYLHLLHMPGRTLAQIVLGKAQAEPQTSRLRERVQLRAALTPGHFTKTMAELNEGLCFVLRGREVTEWTQSLSDGGGSQGLGLEGSRFLQVARLPKLQKNTIDLTETALDFRGICFPTDYGEEQKTYEPFNSFFFVMQGG